MRYSMLSGVAAIAMLWVVTPAYADVPNPVSITDMSIFKKVVSNVDCWAASGVRGTWVAVHGTTVTTQESVIYQETASGMRLLNPAVLYCAGNHGKPGVISNAPHSLVLPVGTQVTVTPVASLILSYEDGGKRYETADNVALREDTRIDVVPNGIVLQQGPHAASVYSRDVEISFGRGVSVSYVRPDARQAGREPAQAAVTGCVVSYMSDRNEVARTEHLANDCSAMSPGDFIH